MGFRLLSLVFTPRLEAQQAEPMTSGEVRAQASGIGAGTADLRVQHTACGIPLGLFLHGVNKEECPPPFATVTHPQTTEVIVRLSLTISSSCLHIVHTLLSRPYWDGVCPEERYFLV